MCKWKHHRFHWLHFALPLPSLSTEDESSNLIFSLLSELELEWDGLTPDVEDSIRLGLFFRFGFNSMSNFFLITDIFCFVNCVLFFFISRRVTIISRRNLLIRCLLQIRARCSLILIFYKVYGIYIYKFVGIKTNGNLIWLSAYSESVKILHSNMFDLIHHLDLLHLSQILLLDFSTQWTPLSDSLKIVSLTETKTVFRNPLHDIKILTIVSLIHTRRKPLT